VLVIDEDPSVSRVLWSTLAAQHHDVTAVAPTTHLPAEIGEHDIEAVVFGPRLPYPAAIDALRRLRRWYDGPAIVVSTADDPDDATAALDAGADDYVRVPFAVGELSARIRALLRRAPGGPDQIVITDDFTVDLSAMRVLKDGYEVHLTPTEWGMLQMLVRNRGRLVGRAELLSQVWGVSRSNKTHYLRVYLGSLRRKLEKDPAHPRHLLTETGMGYRFVV
jgi:two-component system KDP operon response regulator KdpE